MQETKGNRFRDLTNKKFGKLSVIKEVGKHKNNQYKWLCICDCGNESIVFSSNLIRGTSTSCGCYGKNILGSESKKHGLSKSRIFKIWAGIKKRCLNKKCAAYKYYGGKGIKICEKWLNSFENFYEDMKDGYNDKLSLDRIDFNGDYCKENCRWVDFFTQANNKSNNRYIELNGVKKTITQWSRESGINSSVISFRLSKNWDVYDAIFKPTIRKNKIEEISKYLVF